MSSVNDVEAVRNLFNEIYEKDYDLLYDLRYASAGEAIEFEDFEMPEGWKLKVVDNQTEIQYDSYGNGYTEDGYIIFSATDASDSVLYKFPCAYASYDGWDYKVSEISKVEKREKVITTYEWANV